MPIYEYSCKKCGHEMEALQKMSDAPLVKCPACGKRGLSKLVSAASFRLKGGGWYETDFKTGEKKQLADSDSAGGANGGAVDKSSNGETVSGKSAESPAASSSSSEGKTTESKSATKGTPKTGGAKKTATKAGKSSGKK